MSSPKTKKGTLMELTPEEIKDLQTNVSNRMVGVRKTTKSKRLTILRKNLKKYGYRRAFPIVLYEDLVMCDGHHRAQVCV